MFHKLSHAMCLWTLITFTRTHKEERFTRFISPIMTHNSSIDIYEMSNFGSTMFFSSSSNNRKNKLQPRVCYD